MSYQPFLISNYATGFDRDLQPWLLPNDAYSELEDGYVYHGITQKRDGYSGYANGLKSTYTESRMVKNVTSGYTVTGAIDGANATYSIQLDLTPVASPGSVTITGSNPGQVVTDDGVTPVAALVGAGTGTITWATGVIALVFTAPPVGGSTITVVYGNFDTGDGGKTYGETLLNTPVRRGTVVVTAEAQTLTDDGIGGFTGSGTGTVNYTTGVVTVAFTANVTSGAPVNVTYDYHPEFPVMGIMSFYPTTNIRELIVADTTYVNKYNPSTDRLDDISSATAYNGTSTDFWSWVNYETSASAPRLVFCNGVAGDVIQQYDGTTVAAYTKTWAGGTLNARQVFVVRDRLVLFQTIEAGALFPRRIRISGTGANADVFDNTASGAGFIDIPDNTWFFGAAFNRDDILFFTEAATWMMKYTGNDVTPFVLEKIDGSRGSSAAFSVISYLNRSMAASKRGLIMSDGYQVERMDEKLPNFTFDSIDNNNFLHCFSGFLDEDRDVYLIHPSQGVVKPTRLTSGESDRILVTNFEEDNFAIYKLPLSCMGEFQESIAIIWSDLTEDNGYPNWDSLDVKYSNWNAFPFSKGTPLGIGGGHNGQVWRLNSTESADDPQKIRGITIVNSTTLRVTTDYNNYDVGDNISFEDVEGMTEINSKQYPISALSTAGTIFDIATDTSSFTAWTTGGIASKTIPFKALTKQLNPWIDKDKKIRIGWMYFYITVTNTTLTDGNGDVVPAFLDIEVITNDNSNATAPMQYRVNCSNLTGETGSKQWVKIWINQTARFLQFRMLNNQAGAMIQVHAMMPGMMGVGRIV